MSGRMWVGLESDGAKVCQAGSGATESDGAKVCQAGCGWGYRE